MWEGEEKEEKGFDFPIERKPIDRSCGQIVHNLQDFGANSPAQKPLSGVLESNHCSYHYPVARPSFCLLFVQRALPERFEGRIGW